MPSRLASTSRAWSLEDFTVISPSVEGDLCGVVNYEIGYTDGRRDKLHLVDQFLPFTALRERK